MAPSRRGFLRTITAGTAAAMLRPDLVEATAARVQRPTVRLFDNAISYKVGPYPELPPLPIRPYEPRPEYRRPEFLSTSGSVGVMDGFCVAMYINYQVRNGFMRKVPYGFDISSDERKLWLLGRAEFAPRLDHDGMRRHIHHPWYSEMLFGVPGDNTPLRYTEDGRAVIDL